MNSLGPQLRGSMAIVALAAAVWGTAQTTIALNPRATYLRTNLDSQALDATPISLSSLGLSSGQPVMIKQIGVATTNPPTGLSRGLVGLFSSTATLLSNLNLNRVPGALAAGSAFVTPVTLTGLQQTDIPQDFLISPNNNDPDVGRAVVVTVPSSAQYLFFTIPDNFFGNNSVSAAPFGVTIQPVVNKAFTGTVDLQDFPLEFGRDATFEIVIDGGVVDRRVVQLGVNGQFLFFSAFAGPLQVRAKGSHWLSASTAVLNVANSSVTGLSFSLKNGDVDGDNEVSILDYIELSAAYDKEIGQPGFNAEADLDGDNIVSILDYLILSTNYGLGGS